MRYSTNFIVLFFMFAMIVGATFAVIVVMMPPSFDAVCGPTMENVKKYVNVYCVCDNEKIPWKSFGFP